MFSLLGDLTTSWQSCMHKLAMISLLAATVAVAVKAIQFTDFGMMHFTDVGELMSECCTPAR